MILSESPMENGQEQSFRTSETLGANDDMSRLGARLQRKRFARTVSGKLSASMSSSAEASSHSSDGLECPCTLALDCQTTCALFRDRKSAKNPTLDAVSESEAASWKT